MRLTRLLGLLFLAILPQALAAERDPGYDEILEAYQKKRWSRLAEKAPAFLEQKPDYVYAHSIRFMVADSLRQQKRLPEAISAFTEYLENHSEESLADRCRGVLISTLNENREHEAALRRAKDYLDRTPGGKASPRVAFEFASALEGLRRFPEAAAAYRTISGKYAEHSAYRRGVALFRGRRFAEARRALAAFLRLHPGSSWEASAKDYLFRTDTGFSRIRDGVVLEYDGKYAADPRFMAIRDRIPGLRKASLAEIGALLGRPVPDTFLIRFADAGADRSGFFAKTRLEVVEGEPRQVLILYTEYLLLGTHALARTLTHELYHCLQRESLREDHYRTPKWVREGTAVYVAGQAEERTRLLAAEVGRRGRLADPLRILVNGLDGRHTFDDYAEDVAAFLSSEERHGKRKTVALLRRLLETPDVSAAVREVLGEELPEFERAAGERARRILGPMVTSGRAEVLAAGRRLGAKDPEGALDALPEEPGVYAPVASFYRARALLALGRRREALEEVRGVFLAKHRTFAPLLEDALLVELEALSALGDPGYAAAAERARKDLEPRNNYPAVLKLIGE